MRGRSSLACSMGSPPVNSTSVQGARASIWCYDFVFGEGLAAGEGVLGVAPGAAEVAAGEADEDAGETGEGGFALNGFVEFDEVHCGRLTRSSGRSWCRFRRGCSL